jgi:hypothetical protein
MVTRRKRFVVMSLVSVAASVVAGLLSWSGKMADAPAAVVAGAAVFGSTMVFLIAVVEFLDQPEDHDSTGR